MAPKKPLHEAEIRLRLKLYAQPNQQRCPWLRKGSWSHFCCCWLDHLPCTTSTSSDPLLCPFTCRNGKPTHCFCSERVRCVAYLAWVAVGILARGWDGNHSLLAAASHYVGSCHLVIRYPKTAEKGGAAQM